MFRPDLVLDAQKLSAEAASEMAALRRAAESNTVWCSEARTGAAKLRHQRQAALRASKRRGWGRWKNSREDRVQQKTERKGLQSNNPQVPQKGNYDHGSSFY